jgi:hypothetical protein
MCLAIPSICASGGCEAILAATAVLTTPAARDLGRVIADDFAKGVPGPCPPDDEQCKRMNDEVQEKKTVGTLGKCLPSMSMWELRVRYQAWLALAVARAKRDMRCWKGGDVGHQQAQSDAWTQVGVCGAIMGLAAGGPGLR